jgi:hypothetical protein
MADQMSREQFMSLFNQGAPAPAGDADRRQQWMSVMQGPVEKESMPLLDVGTQAVTNLIPSAIKYGQDIYGAITNPAQTVKGLTQLMQAGFQSITPDVIAELIYDPQKAAAAGETAKAVGDYYRNRYGTVENFKQSVAQDPVGVMGDLSTVLAATGGGVKMAATLPGLAPDGRLASLGRNISTVSEYIDPLQGTGKLAAATGTKTLGALTGVGPATVEGAAQAGFRGDKNFLSGMRGTSGDQALENAKYNLNVMRQNRANAYRSGMVDVKNDKSVLDFADIDASLQKAIGQTTFKGQVVSKGAANQVAEAQKVIDEWKNLDPVQFHTPEGMDALKQKVGDILESIPYEQKNARSAVGNIYNSIKSTINAQAPTYANVMRDYAEASDALREIEKTFSLKQGGSADTAMRKLQSITRNNVNTNYGQRLTLAQQLEQEGGRPFISMLQGEAMSGKSARGLAGVGEGAAILGGAFYNPAFLAALPFQTPRVVGEGAYAGGRAARVASAPFRALGVTTQDINTIGTLARPFSEQNEEFRPINLADFYRQSQER